MSNYCRKCDHRISVCTCESPSRGKTLDEVIEEIGEVLCQADGKFIEGIANQVLTDKVEYTGDEWFRVK